MGIGKRKIREIGQAAAKFALNSRCVQIAEDFDSVRSDAIDPLHGGIAKYGALLVTRPPEDSALRNEKDALLARVSRAKEAVKESIIDTTYATAEEISPILNSLEHIEGQIRQGDIPGALEGLESTSYGVFRIMLEKVVTCQCEKK